MAFAAGFRRCFGTELPPHTARQRSPGKPWPKGSSGNATGKAKRLADPGELARRHVRSAIRTLIKALSSTDTAAAVRAAEVLLNQGYGLPRQHLALGMLRPAEWLTALDTNAANFPRNKVAATGA